MYFFVECIYDYVFLFYELDILREVNLNCLYFIYMKELLLLFKILDFFVILDSKVWFSGEIVLSVELVFNLFFFGWEVFLFVKILDWRIGRMV